MEGSTTEQSSRICAFYGGLFRTLGYSVRREGVQKKGRAGPAHHLSLAGPSLAPCLQWSNDALGNPSRIPCGGKSRREKPGERK